MENFLPGRHPNRDFFILDMSDAASKDDMASIEHLVIFAVGEAEYPFDRTERQENVRRLALGLPGGSPARKVRAETVTVELSSVTC